MLEHFDHNTLTRQRLDEATQQRRSIDVHEAQVWAQDRVGPHAREGVRHGASRSDRLIREDSGLALGRVAIEQLVGHDTLVSVENRLTADEDLRPVIGSDCRSRFIGSVSAIRGESCSRCPLSSR